MNNTFEEGRRTHQLKCDKKNKDGSTSTNNSQNNDNGSYQNFTEVQINLDHFSYTGYCQRTNSLCYGKCIKN